MGPLSRISRGRRGSRPAFPKQRVGCLAVRRRLPPVAFDACDLGLEERYAQPQFILRIGCKILCGELARGIASKAGAIIVVHCGFEHRAGRRLLSMGGAASHPIVRGKLSLGAAAGAQGQAKFRMR